MAFLFYFDIYTEICISNCTSVLFVLHLLALEKIIIIIIIIIIITYLLTYLLQISSHSAAVVLTLVQTNK